MEDLAEDRASARTAAVARMSLDLAELTAEPGRLADEVVRRVGELVGDAAALWDLDEQGELQLRAFHHAQPEVREHMLELSGRATHSMRVGVLPHVWNAGDPVVLAGTELERWLPTMQPAYQEYVRAHGMVSLVLVPLRIRGRTVALLGMSRDRPPGHSPDDVAFLEQLAAVATVAVDNSRLLRSLEQRLDEQRRLHYVAQRASLHDPLTGLPNRRLLVERLNALAERPSGSAVLLLVDLDDFKRVNDFYGHHVGDGVLVEVAGRMSEAASAFDSSAVLVRLGGDEFAVLLSGPGTRKDGEVVADQLLASLREPLYALDGRTALSASIGIAVGRAAEAGELLHHADIAMYRAKRAGLGWAVYEATTDAPARMRLRDVGDLQHALQADELVVLYQPLVRRTPTSSPLQHVEALVRWAHPTRGLLAPADFLPLGQSAGLMAELTDQVLRRALSDAAAWHRGGLDVQVSVNVPAEVLADEAVLDHVMGLLDQYGLKPGALGVELTESELLVTAAAGHLGVLRDAGVSIAIDDFGTGYSSLAYLADLPLDRLKLDQSFIARLHDHPRLSKIVRGLVDCAHVLDLDVVAEGVELPSQAERLDALGVEWQQGFLHSRPLALAEATRWLTSR